MTIIKSTHSLVNYTFLVIPPDVLALMQRCYDQTDGRTSGSLLMIFEAYCHLAGHKISFLSLSSMSFVEIARGFLGALADESLVGVGPSARSIYAKGFPRLLQKMRNEIPLLPSLTVEQELPQNNQYIWEKEKKSICPDAVRYWSGWPVQGRKGKISYLPINLIWNSHGKEFAEKIYKLYSQNAEKQLAPAHADFNLLLIFLSQNASDWPAQTFEHPIMIKEFFLKNMFFVFIKALHDGTNLLTKTRSYSKLIHTIETAFIEPGAWARPFSGKLPCPVSKSPPGTHTNIKKTQDGTLVKEKLITAVPLHMTDSEAIEILFKKIKQDNQLVVKWAKKKLRTIRKNQLKRECLAATGTPYNERKPFRIGVNEVCEADICKDFKELGISHIRDNVVRIKGEPLVNAVLDLLAIPNVEHFLAFQVLLVAKHPCLTEGFFTHFELYDKRGNLSGFLKTDTGYKLTGYKDRKGGALSEQVISLTPRQAVWVRQIISLTEPLREELRKAGNDSWRYLFLHCSKSISTPKRPEPMKLNSKTIKYKKHLIREFCEASGESEKGMAEFITRLSVTAFRASCGVEVYLDTHSVEAMAKALGHTTYSSALLSSYLPEPILAFFQTRWIRIFQRGLICEAMKDSPYLLEATQFKTMDELHTFLENHAIREIPEHLKSPDSLKNSSQQGLATEKFGDDSQVLISVNRGMLTTLISLKMAVSNAEEKSNICAKAVYWSKFTDLVVRHIEEEYNSDLQDYLKFARLHANAAHMEGLIYATAT
ncbi:TPA: hypothetical protein L4A27_001082 [Pseudomonas aeruginosa]|nr:hypothetical protein [Pseudomonas aeruginosa]